ASRTALIRTARGRTRVPSVRIGTVIGAHLDQEGPSGFNMADGAESQSLTLAQNAFGLAVDLAQSGSDFDFPKHDGRLRPFFAGGWHLRHRWETSGREGLLFR
ncbi:MAG: hypothetical protein GXP27_17720, partial [Planctomycetes bacterium]|nr:hypothetical protein [Planctomycetota bacterium]